MEGQIMAKTYTIGVKCKDLHEKRKIQRLAKDLEMSYKDLILLGVDLQSSRNKEKALLLDKKKAIIERDKLFKDFTFENGRIKSINNRLKNLKNSRYKKLDEDDKVLVLYASDMERLT